MEKIIIAISGHAQNGKDTAADQMTQLLGPERCGRASLARVVKEQAKMLGWDGKKDEKGRTLLQNISELVKNYHSKDYYVQRCYEDCLDEFEKGKEIIFITDIRYLIETNFFKDRGAFLLRIERPESDSWKSPLTPEQQAHASEAELNNYPFENVIINDGTIDDLKNKLARLLKEKGIE